MALKVDPVLRDLEILIQIHLTAVCLIRNTNHIRPIRQQLRILRKLMNRRQENATAVAALDLCLKQNG